MRGNCSNGPPKDILGAQLTSVKWCLVDGMLMPFLVKHLMGDCRFACDSQ